MIRDGHNNISFFTGIEVEKTPAYGKHTLFVVGLQTKDDIAEMLLTHKDHNINHLYFGANASFASDPIFHLWEELIIPWLTDDFWCTLDISASYVNYLTDSRLVEFNKFIPMISVPLPYIRLLGYNAVLKLDDQDFGSTNDGVWCHSVHSLTNRDSFTHWDEYKKDIVIK